MPVQECQINGESGWQYGPEGKCYVGPDAKAKAEEQGKAMGEATEAEAVDPDYRVPKTPESADAEDATTTGVGERVVPLAGPAVAVLAESFSAYLLEASATAGSYEVRIIAEGTSKNGNTYPPEVLAASVGIFEGAKVFAYELGKGLLDHLPATTKEQIGDGAGLLRNLVGVIEGVAHKTRDGVAGLYGTLKILAPWAQEVVESVFTAGKRDLIGLSIDAKAKTVAEGDTAKVVEIAPNPTVDLVSNPAAGGELLRLVASTNSNPTEGLNMNDTTEPVGTTEETPQASSEAVQATLATLIDVREALTRKVVASGLPEGIQARISESLRDRTFDNVVEAEAAADAEVEAFRSLVADLGPPKVQGFGEAREAASGGAEKLDRLQTALDGLLRGEALRHDDEVVQPFRSIHEAYHEITGKIPGHTASVYDVMAETAGYVPEKVETGWSGRVQESEPGDGFRRVSEAATSTTWSQMLGDSITRSMIAEYKVDDLNTWRQLASDIVSVKDFRTQNRVMFGGYGTLSTVAENANYPNLTTPGDDQETYSVSKYGGIETLTTETLANDDIGALRRIPRALGRAAALTVYRAAFDLLTDNAVMYDAVALFHAGHSNTAAVALTGASLTDVRVAMMDQAAYGNATEVLGAGNAPKFLLVPNELIDLAHALTNPAVYAAGLGDEATHPNSPSNTGITVVPVPFWTNAADHFFFADPRNTPTFEAAFLGGKQTPDLTVADDPRSGGSAFTADKISYRCRIVFGMKFLDWRGVYWQNV